MSNTRKGLPLTSSRLEKIFPTLTSAQISRVAAHGHIRRVERGEVLVEQGDTLVPFFVVITGQLEIVRPYGSYETLVTVHDSGQFTGEVRAERGELSFDDGVFLFEEADLFTLGELANRATCRAPLLARPVRRFT